MTCQRVRIYDDMVVQMLFVNVRYDDRLHVVTESVRTKAFATL